MKANELSIGWAMKQSDPVAALQRVINNVKALGLKGGLSGFTRLVNLG